MSDEKKVMIACVSFETVMVVEPAIEYNASEIHLFHYIRDPGSESSRIYSEFYDEVCNSLKTRLPRIRIVEHADSPIYDFQSMFRDIMDVIDEVRSRPAGAEIGPKSRILINSSAGTSEFSAAAIISSMMYPGTEAFTVGTREYTIPAENIERLYYREGRPVGLTSSVHLPRSIPGFVVQRPEENLVRALRVFHNRQNEGKSVSASAMIEQLKEDDLWKYKMSESGTRTEPEQKETMYYQRHYLQKWDENGWTEKLKGYGKHKVTESGKIIINTFYL